MRFHHLREKEKLSISGACVQAKIIRKEDKKIYLRIWNSGTEPAYNVNFYIPKGHRICILKSRLDYHVLNPGQAFDEYAVADEELLRDVEIVTYWEDERKCLYSMEQTETAKNILKKNVCLSCMILLMVYILFSWRKRQFSVINMRNEVNYERKLQ